MKAKLVIDKPLPPGEHTLEVSHTVGDTTFLKPVDKRQPPPERRGFALAPGNYEVDIKYIKVIFRRMYGVAIIFDLEVINSDSLMVPEGAHCTVFMKLANATTDAQLNEIVEATHQHSDVVDMVRVAKLYADRMRGMVDEGTFVEEVDAPEDRVQHVHGASMHVAVEERMTKRYAKTVLVHRYSAIS